MAQTEQLVRHQPAIQEVFDRQFPNLTNQVIADIERIAKFGEKWPSRVLVLAGAALSLIAVAIKIGLIREGATHLFWYGEFITMIIAGAGLIFFGALFSLYQAWSLRKIINAQQVIGTELLNKQIDIERDLLKNKHKWQGQLILLPSKKLKRLRRC